MNLQGFNKNQIEGVTTRAKYTRIIAGAGSGKTRVLTYRIAYLLEQSLALPSSIMGITFTNKAAGEIKSRVQSLVGDIHDMNLCTIHSWCAKFLRKESHFINYPHNFAILDEEDTKKVMKDIFSSLGYSRHDSRIGKCLNWISSKKNKGLSYEDVKDIPDFNQEIKEFKDFFKLYDERLRNLKAFDFDDLLLKTIDILEDKSNGVQKKYQNYITHILVDEFQDINDVQFHLITLLLSHDAELYVVGDPDQTIYTWRGANNKIILNFEKTLKSIYKDAKVKTIILNQNYRSTKKILNSANLIIKNNIDRVAKDLVSLQEEGEDVAYYNGISASQSANYIASTIKELHESGVKYNSIAILYRANYVSREIETTLNLFDIPYKIYGGLRFYQRKEVKDVIAFLDLVSNPSNDVAFLRIINVPKRQIGQKTIDYLMMGAQNSSQSIYSYILESKDIPLPEKKIKALKSVINILEETRKEINSKDKKETPLILEKMLKRLEFDKSLKEDLTTEEERKENVEELFMYLQSYFLSDEGATLEEFVNNAKLQSSQDEVENGDYVLLMTVHTAKGLEFDNVFIFRLCEGIFPSYKAIEESSEGIEEERRLCYVAFTRAKKRLYLTSDKEYNHVESEPCRPSRFIKEANIKPTLDKNESYLAPNNWKRPNKKYDTFKNINKTNGVTSWSVGDKINHDTFGFGVVQKVENDTIIVQFENEKYGTKTLMAKHYMIHKL